MARKNYTDEFRRRAVGLYESTPGATLKGIAVDLGISRGALKEWVDKLGSGTTASGGAAMPVGPRPESQAARVARLEAENTVLKAEARKLEMERELQASRKNPYPASLGFHRETSPSALRARNPNERRLALIHPALDQPLRYRPARCASLSIGSSPAVDSSSGRYSRAHEPMLYLCSSVDGVGVAMIAHKNARSVALEIDEIDVEASGIVDLRNANVLEAIGIDLADAVAPWQDIAATGGRRRAGR